MKPLFFLIIFLGLILYIYIMMASPSVKRISNKTGPSIIKRGKFYSCKNLRYRPPPLPDPVALVSFPGSGNTWLRHLLQESTGYLTGSVFLDDELFLQNFPAENVSDGSVLVVKMHDGERFLRDNYKAAILMIRTPMKAIMAEFNRNLKGHYKIVKTSVFRRMPQIWESHVQLMTDWWESLHRITLRQSQKPVYVVFYERLLADTRNTLKGVLNFLNQTVTEAELDCAIMNGEGMFRRVNKVPIDPYTSAMHERLDKIEESIIKDATRYMKEHNQTA